jgi:hypothetical protein
VKRGVEKQLAGLQVTCISQNGTVLQDCDAVDADQQGMWGAVDVCGVGEHG